MSPPLSHRPTTPATLLHRVAHHLEAISGRAGAAAGPRLVILEATADHLNIGFLDVPDDPLTWLPGMVAPPSWWAVGFVGLGRAHLLDPVGGPAPAPSAPPVSWPARLVHLVARTGDAISVLHDDPGSAPVPLTGDAGPGIGLLDDHFRRALGLPTAPAPSSTLAFWATLWLDALVEDASDNRLADAPWRDIAARHPVVTLAEHTGGDSPVVRWAIADIERAARLMARSWSWAWLHEAARSGRDVLGAVSAAQASWMDAGLFARVHLALHPPPGASLAALRTVLSPATLRRLHRICRAWGVQL